VKVLVATQLAEPGLSWLRERPDLEVEVLPSAPRAAFLRALADAEAVIVRSQPRVDAEALEHAPRLRVIGRGGMGVDNIDLERATQRGVLVVNAPRDNIDSAAEHTFALLLAVARRIPAFDRGLREGRWEKEALGRELIGKTIGVVGLGKVGQRVARMAQGFGMNVLAFDPFVSPEQFRQAGARRADAVEDLLREADVVTLHVPRPHAGGVLLDRARIALLKPGAIVVNTARGGLVDEAALEEALSSGRLWGAGLDVWAEEPSAGTSLQRLPNVVGTPHLGASTEEAQARVSETIALQVWKALRDEPVDFPVNLPFLEAELAERVAPWTVLAEKMGALLAQTIGASPRAVEIDYGGDLGELRTDRVRAALLKGLVQRVTDERVNVVNAEALTREHGIEVRERRDGARGGYVSTLRACVRHGDADSTLTGTLFDGERPRIVELDGFEMEFPPEENLLLMRWWDRPGVLGRVGTALGEEGVNVARLELSRTRPGRRALAVISTDTAVADDLARRLAGLDSVIEVRAVRL
jgi:D-3-phosphoglycerate dehydrogenase